MGRGCAGGGGLPHLQKANHMPKDVKKPRQRSVVDVIHLQILVRCAKILSERCMYELRLMIAMSGEEKVPHEKYDKWNPNS